MTDVALACDLAVETGGGVQLVRVMHGHQFDPYNAFDDPRSPVDTLLGHHVVRQVLPKLASRDQPGSLLEGVRWRNGDPSAFLDRVCCTGWWRDGCGGWRCRSRRRWCCACGLRAGTQAAA